MGKAAFYPGEWTTEVFSKIFEDHTASRAVPCGEGLRIVATEQSRDPSVVWHARTMLSLCGGEPLLSAEATEAIVFQVKARKRGCFQLFYTAGDVTEPTGGAEAGEFYFAGDRREFVLCRLKDAFGWQGPLRDLFRVDWSSYCVPGDEFLVESILFFDDLEEAEAFASEGNRGRGGFEPELVQEPDVPEIAEKKGFYVCRYERRLVSRADGILGRFDTLEEAKKVCEDNRLTGYRVADETGALCYAPYRLLACNILREGKYVTDFVRTHGFRYGDAPVNPGVDHEAGLVSCDRLVCWVFYRLGFVRQPLMSGVVVSAFPQWCRDQNFPVISDWEALEPGDVMLVRPHPKGYPQHAFLFAGYADPPRETEKTEGEGTAQKSAEPIPTNVAAPDAVMPAGEENEIPEIYSYRYDCGSDTRIQNVQPSCEKLFWGAFTPFCLFRPRVTEENNLFFRYYRENGEA